MTNSSSSSYILSFKSEKTVYEELENDQNLSPAFLDRMYEYILNNFISKNEAITAIKEGIKDDLFYEFSHKYDSLEIVYSDKVQAEMDKKVERIYKKRYKKLVENGNTLFADVEFEDCYDSEFEYGVIPFLENAIIRISHH